MTSITQVALQYQGPRSKLDGASTFVLSAVVAGLIAVYVQAALLSQLPQHGAAPALPTSALQDTATGDTSVPAASLVFAGRIADEADEMAATF